MNELLTQFNITLVIAAIAVVLLAPWLISRIARKGAATVVTVFGMLAVGVIAAAVV